jgi:alpha-N-arabinofuranosidase
MYKVDGYYYLLISEGGTEYGHMLTLARSTKPWGPFEACPHNPILSHRSLKSPIQATGHADLVQAQDGNWWLVCLGIRPQGYPHAHHLGRETFLTPVQWPSGAWPTVGHNGRIELEMDGPALPRQPWPEIPDWDVLHAPQLGPAWNFLRNPQPESWSLQARPGWLRLACLADGLNGTGSPAWVGRRQERFDCRVLARLEFDPATEHEEAGLVVWMNERHHYEVGITLRAGRRVAVVRRRIGSLQAEEACLPLPPGAVTLVVDANTRGYAFACAANGDSPVELAGGEARYLSTEVAGGFTGVYFALYATANGHQSENHADFDWFECV